MKVLVTGAAGFIGSHLVHRLLEDVHVVTGIDNLLTGDIRNLADLKDNPSLTFRVGDVRKVIRDEVDLVFNLACPASPVDYQKHPITTFTTSVMGAQNLARLAQRTGCRIVHASTSEVYGDPLVHPQDETYWGNVNPIGKRACYDEGKRAAETLFSIAGIDVRIVRIFNTYGPHMKPNDGRVVSNLIIQALHDDPITLYGDGQQTRSFCYVDDLVNGLVAVAQLPELDGPLNLGNPQETSIKTLANQVIGLAESKSVIVHKPLPEDDPRRRRPDITKAIKTIGFRARVPLKKGLEQTISYFRKRLA